MNYTDEIFRIVKVHRTPRPVYEVQDVNGTLIEGQFYGEELTPARVSKRTVYEIYKVQGKRYRNGIFEYLFAGKGIERILTRGFLQPV